MQCPVCQYVDLVIAERQNVEIDYCPRCRGVWLDRGELDKIIERAAAQVAPPARPRDDDDDDRDRRYREEQRRDYYPKKKREGFLGELFDF